MENYRVTIYRAGGVGYWQTFPVFADAMEYLVTEQLAVTPFDYVSALIQERCDLCSDWYNLGSHNERCTNKY
jgi:hypothetical protein